MNWYVAEPAREELAAWGIHERCADVAELGETVRREPGRESRLLLAAGRSPFRLRRFLDVRQRRHAESEFRILEVLRARGLSAPEPVATASREDGQSVLVLRDVPGRSLPERLRGGGAPGEVRALQEAVAGELRRWHECGALHGQLFAWHVVGGDAGTVTFVDAGGVRLYRPGRLPGKLRGRDWAALFATLPLALLSSAARRRMLRAYGLSRGELRRLWPGIRVAEVRWRREGRFPRAESRVEWRAGAGCVQLSGEFAGAARSAGMLHAEQWFEPEGARTVRQRDERRNRVWPRALQRRETWYGKEYFRGGAHRRAAAEVAAHQALEWLGLPCPAIAAWATVPGRAVLWTRAVEPGFTARDRLHAMPRGETGWRRGALAGIAELARRLHAAGFHHRDLYLDHFLWEDAHRRWVLIDLARVQEFPRLPWRLRVKDLAALEYSARTAGVALLERARAFRTYWRGPEAERRRILKAVLRRADRIQRRESRKGRFPVPVPEACGP